MTVSAVIVQVESENRKALVEPAILSTPHLVQLKRPSSWHTPNDNSTDYNSTDFNQLQ